METLSIIENDGGILHILKIEDIYEAFLSKLGVSSNQLKAEQSGLFHGTPNMVTLVSLVLIYYCD